MREGNGHPPSPVEDQNRDAGSDAGTGTGSLRERLRVYETFDEVISESVRRARNFLDEAAEMRDRVKQELAEARRELEEEIAEARRELQEEIAEARAEIEEERNELVSIARTILHRSGSNKAGEPAAEPEPVTPYPLDQEPAQEAEQKAALIPAPVTSGSSPPRATHSTANPAEPGTPLVVEPVPAADPIAEAEPAPEPESEPAPAIADEAARTTIIIHGIHRPAMATGLQRYLLAQPGVTSVEPREFAEGILRLQVHGTAAVDDALFAGWADGAGLTVIQRVPRTVEVILPSAN